MNLQQLFHEIDRLSPEDRDKLRTYLTEPPPTETPRTINGWINGWIAELESVANAFRGDSSDEEMREIVAAITTKSTPSERPHAGIAS